MKPLIILSALLSASVAWAETPVASGSTVAALVGTNTTSISVVEDYNGSDPDLRGTVFYFSGTSLTPETGGFPQYNDPTGTSMTTYAAASIAANPNDSNTNWLYLAGGSFPIATYFNQTNSPTFGYLQSGKTRTRMKFMFNGTWTSGAVVMFLNGKVNDTTSKYYANQWGTGTSTSSNSSIPSIVGGGEAVYPMVADTVYQIEQRVERIAYNPTGKRTGRTYIRDASGALLSVGYTTATSVTSIAPSTANHMILLGNDTANPFTFWLKEVRVQNEYPFDLTVGLHQGFETDTLDATNLGAATVPSVSSASWAVDGSRMSISTGAQLTSPCTINLFPDNGTRGLSYNLNGTDASAVRYFVNKSSAPGSFLVSVVLPTLATGTYNEFIFIHDGVVTHPLFRMYVQNIAGVHSIKADGLTSSTPIEYTPGTRYELAVDYIRNGTCTIYLDDANSDPVSGSPQTFTGAARSAVWIGLGGDSGIGHTSQAGGTVIKYDNFEMDTFLHLRRKE